MEEDTPERHPERLAELGSVDRVGHDPTTGAFHGRFDREDPDLFVPYLVKAVAASLGCEPLELDPLYEYVPPDALTSVVCEERRAPVEVRFEYCGCDISVVSGGELTINPRE